MAKYSLKEIRSSYAQKRTWEKQFPVTYFIVRPLSFYITCLVLKITQEPVHVVIFGFFLGIAGCFLLAGSAIWSLWPGILLILMFSIFDAVDGNIARTTQKVTLFGKYLDGLVGNLIEGSYFFFMGIGLYFALAGQQSQLIAKYAQDHAQAVPLFLGSVILICKLWATDFEKQYDFFRIRKEGSAPSDDSQLKKVAGTSTFSDRWYYRVFLNLGYLNNQLLALILLTLLNLEIWFLIFFACYYTGKAVLYFVFFFMKTRFTLLRNNRPA